MFIILLSINICSSQNEHALIGFYYIEDVSVSLTKGISFKGEVHQAIRENAQTYQTQLKDTLYQYFVNELTRYIPLIDQSKIDLHRDLDKRGQKIPPLVLIGEYEVKELVNRGASFEKYLTIVCKLESPLDPIGSDKFFGVSKPNLILEIQSLDSEGKLIKKLRHKFNLDHIKRKDFDPKFNIRNMAHLNQLSEILISQTLPFIDAISAEFFRDQEN